MKRLQQDDLEKDGPKRIHIRVGPLRIPYAKNLFRGHVPKGAKQHTRRSFRGVRQHVRSRVGQGDPRVIELGDAPIENVNLAVLPEHDVRRLEVSVNDAAGMGAVDRHADIREGREQLSQRILGFSAIAASAQSVKHSVQSFPTNSFHREERIAFVVLIDVMNGHDGRMVELSLNPSFSPKTFVGDGSLRMFRLEALEGDLATEPAVVNQAHRPHAPLAKHDAVFVTLFRRG
jgi:hypothetical protein